MREIGLNQRLPSNHPMQGFARFCQGQARSVIDDRVVYGCQTVWVVQDRAQRVERPRVDPHSPPDCVVVELPCGFGQLGPVM